MASQVRTSIPSELTTINHHHHHAVTEGVLQNSTNVLNTNFSEEILNASWVDVPRGCQVRSREFLPTNNPRNILSVSTAGTVEVIVYCVLMPLLALLGLFTNPLSAAVFYKLGLKKGTNLCLFLLSLSDMMFLLTKTLTRVSKVILNIALGKTEGASRFAYTMPTYHLIKKSELFLFYSNFLTTVASLERCVSIVRPFKARLVFSHTLVVCVLVLGFLVALPFFVLFGFRNEPVCIYVQETGLRMWAIGGTLLYKNNKQAFDIIFNVVVVFIFPVVSLTMMVVSTCIIIYQLRKAAKWRYGTSGNRGNDEYTGMVTNKAEMQLYKMLVVVSAVHVACTIPTLFKEFGKLVDEDLQFSGRYSNLHSVVLCLKDLASSVNCTVNVFVYFTHSSQFRTTLHSLLAPNSAAVNSHKSVTITSSASATKDQ